MDGGMVPSGPGSDFFGKTDVYANPVSYKANYGFSTPEPGGYQSVMGPQNAVNQRNIEGWNQGAIMGNAAGGLSSMQQSGYMHGLTPEGYATGGNPAVGLPFVAGENGPELITARSPVTVHPNRSGGSGDDAAPQITINNNTPAQVQTQTQRGSDGMHKTVITVAMLDDLATNGPFVRALQKKLGVRAKGR
jgi:hypothetical protein